GWRVSWPYRWRRRHRQNARRGHRGGSEGIGESLRELDDRTPAERLCERAVLVAHRLRRPGEAVREGARLSRAREGRDPAQQACGGGGERHEGVAPRPTPATPT